MRLIKGDEYLEGTQEGLEVLTNWGRIGFPGERRSHQFAEASQAAAALEQLAMERRHEGFVDEKARTASTSAREPDLEAAMLRAPENRAAALVYADWLQAHGNVWGELISVQHAKRTETVRAREATLIAALDLPDPLFTAFTWRKGLIRALHLFNEKDWMDDEFDPLPIAKAAFELPMGDALEELRIGILRWNHNVTDVPAVLELASRQLFAPTLTRLHLGDIPENVDMAHHAIGDVRALSSWFPALRWLTLHSSDLGWEGRDNFEFAPLNLPDLETLIIETCSMSSARLEALLKSTVPSLQTLELWFGAPDRGAVADPAELAPILSGKAFPRLRHLGLKNAEFTSALCEALPEAAIAPQLETLDLSMGTLDAVGVPHLIEAAKAFTKLKRLVVSDNFLDSKQGTALRAAFRGVTVVAKDQKDDAYDPGQRYCSVQE